MSKEINISYTWDKTTFLTASKATYDYNLKHSPKRFLGWIFIALTQFGVVGALKKDVYGLLIVSTFLVIYWYALRWPLRKIMLQRSFKNLPNKNHKFQMSADKKGIKIDNGFIPWDTILEVVSLENGFLLYYEKTFLYIPKNAFVNADEKDSFSHLAKERVDFYIKEI